MLCEKNRCRGTLFEYELMHNFHYFLCVLSSPRPSFSTTHTPARRITRMARRGGGGLERTASLPILYPFFLSLPVLQWRRVGKGDGFEVRVRDLFGEDSPPHQIIYRTRRPACRIQVMNDRMIPCAMTFNPSAISNFLMFLFHQLAYSSAVWKT